MDQGGISMEKSVNSDPGINTKDIDERLVRDINSDKPVSNENMKITTIIVYVILISLGIGTGYLLAGKTGSQPAGTSTAGGLIVSDKVVGSQDNKTFKDSATGKLEKGGLDGEGTHKLIRDGGPSQTVYLMSSVVNLDEFAGQNVKVWGETFAAEKAGWLMDVGKVEKLN